MKHFYLILLLSTICFSCNSRQKQNEISWADLEFNIPEDSIETATAIIWIDKFDKKNHDVHKTRKAKAKVRVTEDGKVEVIEFVKNYPKEVQNYIRHKIPDFRISKPMLEHGYIKPAEQFMQIRYSAYLMKELDYVYK